MNLTNFFVGTINFFFNVQQSTPQLKSWFHLEFHSNSNVMKKEVQNTNKTTMNISKLFIKHSSKELQFIHASRKGDYTSRLSIN